MSDPDAPQANSSSSRPWCGASLPQVEVRGRAHRGTCQEAPLTRLWKFLLLSDPSFQAPIPSQLWIGLPEFWGLGFSSFLLLVSAVFWPVTGVTGPERPSNSPGGIQQAFWQRAAGGRGLGQSNVISLGGSVSRLSRALSRLSTCTATTRHNSSPCRETMSVHTTHHLPNSPWGKMWMGERRGQD